MKYPHSRSFWWLAVLAMGVALVWGGLAYRTLQTDQNVNYVARGIRYADRNDPWCQSPNPADRQRYAAMIQRSEEWFDQLASRYPDLMVACRDVPDENNGFLRWLEFSENAEQTPSLLEMPLSLLNALDGNSSFDRFAARQWVAEKRKPLDELLELSALPDRSVKGIAIDRWSKWNPALPEQAANALALEARLAAEDGDEARALECSRAVMRLADHFDQIEAPGRYQIGAAIRIRNGMHARIIRDLVPHLAATDWDPRLWEPLASKRPDSPAERGRLLRGLWQGTLRGFILPTSVNLETLGCKTDAQQLVDAYSDQMRRMIGSIEKAPSLAEMPPWNTPVVAPRNLTRECRDLFEMAFAGGGRESWLRAQIEVSLTSAAFEIMRGKAVPNEPVSGKPYDWDASRRILTLPNEPRLVALKVPPVEVPRVSWVHR